MAVIFLDTFTGSGLITSHTADTGADGAWLTPPGDGEPEIAGGEVYSAGGTDAANAPTSFAMAPFTIEAECASLGIDGGLLVGVFGLDGADLPVGRPKSLADVEEPPIGKLHRAMRAVDDRRRRP